MKLIINIFIALIVLSGSCFAQDTVQIGQWRGNTVLINLFATWCGLCSQEMQHLEKDIWQRFKDKKFRLIAMYIPRNILIDSQEKIVYQERGFDQETWEALIQQIETLVD